ncbi:MAG: putative LPS assembly protein LptD [Gemmatimonadota bacterium]
MRAGWIAAFALALAATSGVAQVPRRERLPLRPDPGRARADTARQRADSAARDTSRAGRGSGLPQRPSRSFATPDSVTQSLLNRRGFRITRYNADSVQFLAEEKEIRLSGRALIERDQSTLEADSVRYQETNCDLIAVGSPKLFDRTGVLVGVGMRYDACNHAGIIENATTDFEEGSATWFLRGNLAVDNEENRTYAAHATITSCDLVDPHYHFAARDVKWVSKRLMVSRPAVLYVADVPILWLPFIFQDMRRGRRSGLMPPQFGINDIVRNSPQYQRHVTNLGYYWALSDYTDAQVSFDWYAQRFTTFSGRFRYRWLDRFMSGGLSLQELHEAEGSSSRRIFWSHQQNFSLNSSLTASLDYASSSRIISRNSVDPLLAVATIDSRLQFQRRFDWGTLSIGGNRTQSLDKPLVTTNFPRMDFTPSPIALSGRVTWSPSFSLQNSLTSNAGPGYPVFRGPGAPDTALVDSRQTSMAIATPFLIGRFNWSNSVSITDAWSSQREVITVPDPADTTRSLVRTYGESFATEVDWNTGINLPVIFQGTWRLSPRIQIVNNTGGPFLLRNRFTEGAFVSQGKRLQYSAGISPAFFGLFGGIGPIARIRHSVSPSLSWAFSPAATVPEDYARAISRDGRVTTRHSDARQTLTLGLSQNFEAKLRLPRRPAGADTSAADSSSAAPGANPEQEGRKIKLLSIQSGGIAIDLEQAKKRGRTGWLTDNWGNTFSSDLLRGFSLATQHDLFDGPVGTVGSRFRPFLTGVTAGFSLGAGTLRTLGSILGLRAAPISTQARPDSSPQQDSVALLNDRFGTPFQRGPNATRSTALAQLAPRIGAGGGFAASLNYSLSRQRPRTDSGGTQSAPAPAQQTVSGSLSFQPTAHWSVSWQTSYNFTRNEFSDHVVRLDRDLHDWRATFTFIKSANGNFLFSFFIQLIDQPDIKFDYDQRNIQGR